MARYDQQFERPLRRDAVVSLHSQKKTFRMQTTWIPKNIGNSTMQFSGCRVKKTLKLRREKRSVLRILVTCNGSRSAHSTSRKRTIRTAICYSDAFAACNGTKIMPRDYGNSTSARAAAGFGMDNLRLTGRSTLYRWAIT